MSSMTGKNIKISIFGQSHSKAIGVTIDGLPSGEKIDFDKILEFMARRAPGKNQLSTSRNEADFPEILSGLVDSQTCGAPLTAVIYNNDTRSGDYKNIMSNPRPGHADFTANIKYKGFNDVRGGGHFSGRLTAPLCFAGAVCMQILERRGILIGSHISSIYNSIDDKFNSDTLNGETFYMLSKKPFAVLNDSKGNEMKQAILDAKQSGDSVGGVIEVAAIGVPAGLGEPMFDGVENRISAAMFGIPAVKGIEFGAGFESSKMLGSQNNDELFYGRNGDVFTRTNNHGGILGGITSGMPVVARVAFKPTPSIAKEQQTINLDTKTNDTLIIKGRHDPCIVPRAIPCTESVFACTLLDMLLDL